MELNAKSLRIVLAVFSVLLLISLFTVENRFLMGMSLSSWTGTSDPLLRASKPWAFEHGRICTPEEIQKNAALSPQSNSNCPKTTHIILTSLLTHRDERLKQRSPVIVQIGCNKGDDFVSVLRLFSKSEIYSTQKVYQWYQGKEVIGFACGGDEEIDLNKVPEFPTSQLPVPVRGYCVEPMETTFEVLKSMFQDLNFTSPDVRLIHAAASSVAGVAKFPKAGAGTEHLGLHNTDGETFDVTVITIKDLVLKEGIHTIDFLSVDTEGHDVQVLIGGIPSIVDHNVRYIEFEHHGMGRWVTSSLRDLTDIMDQFGYDCYWNMNSGKLARITGCWDDSYLQKSWSNVACISRLETATHQLMETTLST